jgi:cell division septum initiation protein DivIVA
MKIVDTGKIVVVEPPPRDGKMATLAAAGADLDRLHEATDRQCAIMLSAARAEADRITAGALAERDAIVERIRKFEDAIRPIAKSIVDA